MKWSEFLRLLSSRKPDEVGTRDAISEHETHAGFGVGVGLAPRDSCLDVFHAACELSPRLTRPRHGSTAESATSRPSPSLMMRKIGPRYEQVMARQRTPQSARYQTADRLRGCSGERFPSSESPRSKGRTLPLHPSTGERTCSLPATSAFSFTAPLASTSSGCVVGEKQLARLSRVLLWP